MGSGGRVRVHADARAFLEDAGPFLRSSPAEHNLILSIAEETADGAGHGTDGPPFFASILERGEVAGAVFRTPPHKLGLTRMPMEAVQELAETVAGRWRRLPAVLGPAEPAEAFARAWSRIRGQEWRPGEEQCIYRLDRVDPPIGVSGRMRVAAEDDAPLVERWCAAFADELGETYAVSPETQREWLRDGTAVLWGDPEPTCMAVGRGFTSGGARIGYVYTPSEARGNGYASALVAALSQRLLDGGLSFCILYALASNPVSNGIYQRIGYRPVASVRDVTFHDGADG